jgi:release factor glutamine methyltransferase
MNDNSSTANQWLKIAVRQLKASDIATARLDALVLLEDALGKDRSWILAHPDAPIDPEILELLNEQVKRRAGHEPLAYIRGFTEFYGRKFAVDHRVLEPRPESETMINILKSLKLPPFPKIADIGTGSGALGLTAALEIPASHVTLVDIDVNCLAVAQQNANDLNVDAAVLQGDLLDGLQDINVALCNLPYVPDDFHINEAAMQEPKLAIFGGPDGLDLYRKLFAQLDDKAVKYVLTESLPFQHDDLTAIAKSHHYKQKDEDDFIQLFEKF